MKSRSERYKCTTFLDYGLFLKYKRLKRIVEEVTNDADLIYSKGLVTFIFSYL